MQIAGTVTVTIAQAGSAAAAVTDDEARRVMRLGATGDEAWRDG
jgi:hypothetical protein